MEKTVIRLIFFVIFIFFVKLITAQTNSVVGFAFLEFQQNHNGIKVKFQRVAPTSLIDSTYTDSTGYFSKVLESGIYKINFSKPGFINLQLPDMPIYQNTVIENQTLETIGLSGELSGQLVAGTYKVGADIFVPFNKTLVIEPGTILKFKNDLSFMIYGTLKAEGTRGDSIKFTRYSSDINWRGIDFKENSSASSLIKYCVIEYSNDRGICVYKCSPSISNSTIQYNTHYSDVLGMDEDDGGGAGLCLKFSSSRVDNVMVRYNSGITMGCGIFCSNGNPYISNSIITNNVNPSAYYQQRPGGGIMSSYGAKLTIENSVICYNDNTKGGGIYLASTYGGSLIAEAKVLNCIIYENTSLGEYNSGAGAGIYNPNGTILSVFNSLLWNNHNDNFHCIDPWLGINVTVNSNEDSCDAYGNIVLDPLFVDPFTGNYNLAPGSPCIDAGANINVTSNVDFALCYRIWDGNGDADSIVDIGSFEYGSQIVIVGDYTDSNYPISNVFIYPNPSTSSINIDLDGYMKAEFFNMSGMSVLTSESKSTDISTLKCGLYVVKIHGGNSVIKYVKLLKQ